MPITDEQLIKWSESPSGVSLESLRTKLETILQETGKRNGVKFEVYLQGSFANATNLSAGSDVDLVIEQSYPRLSDIPQSTAQAEQEWTVLSNGVLKDLQKEIGSATAGTNSIKITLKDKSTADVVVALSFIKNSSTPGNVVPAGTQGICFIRREGTYGKRWTVNFPKQHIRNSEKKEQRTNNRYKRIVRVFKHLKAHCKPSSGMRFSSYLVEALVYNADDRCFVDDVPRSTRNVMGVLSTIRSADLNDLKCPNGITKLCGTGPDQFTESEIFALRDQLRARLG